MWLRSDEPAEALGALNPRNSSRQACPVAFRELLRTSFPFTVPKVTFARDCTILNCGMSGADIFWTTGNLLDQLSDAAVALHRTSVAYIEG